MTAPTQTLDTSTEAFHAGEQALQARVGVRERMAAAGPMLLRDYMPDQHRELFEKLPTLLLGALDEAGQPWATMVAGALEGSNVNAVEAMVGMIAASRQFEQQMKLLTTAETNDKTASQLLSMNG